MPAPRRSSLRSSLITVLGVRWPERSASHCRLLGNDSSTNTALTFGVRLIAFHSSSVGPVSPENAIADPPFSTM